MEMFVTCDTQVSPRGHQCDSSSNSRLHRQARFIHTVIHRPWTTDCLNRRGPLDARSVGTYFEPHEALR